VAVREWQRLNTGGEGRPWVDDGGLDDDFDTTMDVIQSN